MVEHLDHGYQLEPLAEPVTGFNSPQYESIFGQTNNANTQASSDLFTTASNGVYSESTDMFGSIRTDPTYRNDDSNNISSQSPSELIPTNSNGYNTESTDMFRSVSIDEPPIILSNWWYDVFNVPQSTTVNRDSPNMFSSVCGDNVSSDMFQSDVESLCGQTTVGSETDISIILNTPSDNSDASGFRGFSFGNCQQLPNIVDKNNVYVRMANDNPGPSHHFPAVEMNVMLLPSTTVSSFTNTGRNEDMIHNGSETFIAGKLNG